MGKIQECQFELIQKLLYSPDLTRSDSPHPKMELLKMMMT